MMEEVAVTHADQDKEGVAVEDADRLDESGFDRRALRRRLESVPVDVRQALAREPGPGWLWWYGPDDRIPTMTVWHFAGLQKGALFARPFTPHPDAPVATRGNAELSIWLPASPSSINKATIHLVGRQRFWRLTMNRALDLKTSHCEYESTMSVGESLRMLMGVLGEVDVREVGA